VTGGYDGLDARTHEFLRLLSVTYVMAMVASLGSAATSSQGPARYERPDAQTVKACTRQIVSDPRFARRMSLGEWLAEKLAHGRGPGAKLPAWLGRGLLWTILTWCVLTLLAITAHLVWTIWLLVRPARHIVGTEDSLQPDGYDAATAEQLWQRSTELAQRGAFREAMGVLSLALLRKLESLQVLRFHKSKTNGEYVREYPPQRAGRREFARFVATFERSIYGGRAVPEQTHRTMSALAERIIQDASQST
jgi:hypothetical protein